MSIEDDRDWQELSKAQQKFEDENPDKNRPAGPLYQAAALDHLLVERKRFEAGDRMALLAAIRRCACHDLPLPDWASRAYIRAYDKVLNCQSNSWDEVFGKPYPGKHLASLLTQRQKGPAIYQRIRYLRKEHYEAQEDGSCKLVSSIPIDEALFERVGEEFGMKKTRCSVLYYKYNFKIP